MSEKRTAANRRNAKLSTGPISTKGKRKSALNAVKHGLSIPTDRADDTVLALAALCRQLRQVLISRLSLSKRRAELLISIASSGRI
jgi:hypothetical protein